MISKKCRVVVSKRQAVISKRQVVVSKYQIVISKSQVGVSRYWIVSDCPQQNVKPSYQNVGSKCRFFTAGLGNCRITGFEYLSIPI